MPKKPTTAQRLQRLEDAVLMISRALNSCPDIDDHRKWDVEDAVRVISGLVIPRGSPEARAAALDRMQRIDAALKGKQ